MPDHSAPGAEVARRGLPKEAYEEIPGDRYVPYVLPSAAPPEFTFKSVLVGALVSIVFGAANAYLGLKVGLTVSASIPAAVIGAGIFRLFKKGTILETNMVQTIGSAGESLAAGVIFTIPALFLWGVPPDAMKVFVLSAIGGILGTLFMIPLRRYLIVREHGKLPYPEGTACAEVLVSAEEGGAKARLLFAGLGLGALYQALSSERLFGLWKREPVAELTAPSYRTEFAGEVAPELLGVGYIIGPRISAVMLAGGALGWLVLIPLIALFGAGLDHPLFPEKVRRIAEMPPGLIWSRYVRYVGAGAVAFGGFATLVRSIPTILGSFRMGLSGLRAARGAGAAAAPRTDRDIPLPLVLAGAAAAAVALALLPKSYAPVGIAGGLAVVVFSFIFVTVSSRLVGLVGSSSNPISGMTIATLLATALLWVAAGWTEGPLRETARVSILLVGAIVCTASAVAGDISQDLKTGFLVGATPSLQQRGELIGVLAGAAAIGPTLYLLNSSYGFGEGGDLPAPQANLMKLVIEGVVGGDLPWGLVLAGAAIGGIVEMLGLPTLALAVGLYLPLSLSTPIMAGGLVRLFVETRYKGKELEGRRERGVLFSSGLIAGAALLGVLVAGLAFAGERSLPLRHGLETLRRSGVRLDLAGGGDVQATLVLPTGATEAMTVAADGFIPIRSAALTVEREVDEGGAKVRRAREEVRPPAGIALRQVRGGGPVELTVEVEDWFMAYAVRAEPSPDGKGERLVAEPRPASDAAALAIFLGLAAVLLGAACLGREGGGDPA